MKNSEVALRYIIYRQPLSLDRYMINILISAHFKSFSTRFFIHDVSASESTLTKLENAFVLISLNRFVEEAKSIMNLF